MVTQFYTVVPPMRGHPVGRQNSIFYKPFGHLSLKCPSNEGHLQCRDIYWVFPHQGTAVMQ